MEPSFRVPMAVLAKTGSQGWRLYDAGYCGGFDQTCTSYVNQKMMMAEEISSKDRNQDWGQIKSPMITFGPELERYDAGPTAVHGRAVSSNETDTRI